MSMNQPPWLFKRRKEVQNSLLVLPGLRDHVGDADLPTLLPAYQDQPGEQIELGFQDKGCRAEQLIVLPGPSEATNGAHLHLDERYTFTEEGEATLAFYRYEICWAYDLNPERRRDDYCVELLVQLRRGLRFDYHPARGDTDTHPTFHWHPNGCSELRFGTEMMTPLHAAVFAYMSFGTKVQKEIVEAEPRTRNVLTDLRKSHFHW